MAILRYLRLVHSSRQEDQKRHRAISGDDSAGKFRIGEFGDITRRIACLEASSFN
jgi:hypothetical protein